ncbi:ABC transporter permease [Paenibacillus sp. CMAA1364]
MNILSNFYNLILNENIKIYRRLRTWIMLSILAIFSIVMPIIFYSSQSSELPNVWEVTMLTMTITFFLNIIFVVVISADSVASEFSGGTIKLLLIRPWSRSKILLSKFTSVIMFSLLSTLVLFGLTFLSSNIWFNYEGSSGMFISDWSNGSYTFLTLGSSYIQLLIIMMIAFMISTLFRSSTFAIAMSLFILFTKDIFLTILSPDRYEWMKYVLFTHMDLKGYIHSSQGPAGSTLTFSIVILACYCAIFIFLSWYVFKKRDVAT